MFTSVRYTVAAFILILACCQINGCTSPQDAKERLDRQAYQMIEEKWNPQFGPRANYRISDVAPSPNDIPLDQPLPESLGTLTLPQAVALATGHNRQYQTMRENLYAKALDLRLTRHQFERRYLGFVAGTYHGDRNDQVISAEATAGFNRLLADGTQLGVSLTAAWADVVTGNLRGGLAGILGLDLVKPLLRGSDRRVVLEGLTQAERDLLYEVRAFNEFRKSLVVDIVGNYYTVLVALDRVRNARQYQRDLEGLLKVAIPLAQGGRVGLYEVDRIRQQIMQAQAEILQLETGYEQMLDQFKLKMGISTTIRFDLDPGELETLARSGLPCPDLQEKTVLDTALVRRLDLANEADRLIDARRKVEVARDLLKADLNIVASGRSSTNTSMNRRTLLLTDNEFKVGVQADLPFDRVDQENQYRLALIAVSQQQRQYELLADTISAQARQSYRTLREAAQRYRISSDGLDLASKRLADTTLLLRYAKTNTRRVLDAIEDLRDARDQATEALADYAIATLQFYRDIGLLQIRPDGMWQL